jgi:hypothetical protein
MYVKMPERNNFKRSHYKEMVKGELFCWVLLGLEFEHRGLSLFWRRGSHVKGALFLELPPLLE